MTILNTTDRFPGYVIIFQVFLTKALLLREEGLLPYLRNSKGELEKYLPYGERGDRLWVKERFAPVHFEIEALGSPSIYVCYACDQNIRGPIPCTPQEAAPFIRILKEQNEQGIPFLSARLMPRFASRISLTIENLRVKRLWDLSQDNVEKEGLVHFDIEKRLMLFRSWWDKVHSEGVDSRSNPFVWVIDFQVSSPQDAIFRKKAWNEI